MKRVYSFVGAVAGWFALALQLYLMLRGRSGFARIATVWTFLGFFTILSNILVAATLTVSAAGGDSRLKAFLERPATSTAIAVYISVTGLIYFFILRHLWNPVGWAFVADALLYYVMPIVYVLFWILFVPKGQLRWRDVGGFVLFPIVYAVYSLIAGLFTGYYPYPFIDLNELGPLEVAVNAVIIIGFFALLSLIYIGIDRLAGRRA